MQKFKPDLDTRELTGVPTSF